MRLVLLAQPSIHDRLCAIDGPYAAPPAAAIGSAVGRAGPSAQAPVADPMRSAAAKAAHDHVRGVTAASAPLPTSARPTDISAVRPAQGWTSPFGDSASERLRAVDVRRTSGSNAAAMTPPPTMPTAAQVQAEQQHQLQMVQARYYLDRHAEDQVKHAAAVARAHEQGLPPPERPAQLLDPYTLAALQRQLDWQPKGSQGSPTSLKRKWGEG